MGQPEHDREEEEAGEKANPCERRTNTNCRRVDALGMAARLRLRGGRRASPPRVAARASWAAAPPTGSGAAVAAAGSSLRCAASAGGRTRAARSASPAPRLRHPLPGARRTAGCAMARSAARRPPPSGRRLPVAAGRHASSIVVGCGLTRRRGLALPALRREIPHFRPRGPLLAVVPVASRAGAAGFGGRRGWLRGREPCSSARVRQANSAPSDMAKAAITGGRLRVVT